MAGLKDQNAVPPIHPTEQPLPSSHTDMDGGGSNTPNVDQGVETSSPMEVDTITPDKAQDPLPNPKKRLAVELDGASGSSNVRKKMSLGSGKIPVDETPVKKGSTRRPQILQDDKKTLPGLHFITVVRPLCTDIKTGTSCFDCHNNEAKVAAYLGYKDIAAYRLFRFSTPVLHAMITYSQSNMKKKHIKEALEIIDEVGAGQVNRTNADFHSLSPGTAMATLLVSFVEDIKKSQQQSLEELKESYQTVISKFNTQVGSKRKVEVPRIDIGSVQWPELGPLEVFGEHELEVYARAYNVLFSLDHVLAKSRFEATFKKAKFPWASTRIGDTVAPT